MLKHDFNDKKVIKVSNRWLEKLQMFDFKSKGKFDLFLPS